MRGEVIFPALDARLVGIEERLDQLSRIVREALDLERALTVRDYAKKYQISQATVRRALKRGELRSKRVGNCVRIIDKRDACLDDAALVTQLAAGSRIAEQDHTPRGGTRRQKITAR